MNAIEIPASVPSIAARGVKRRIVGPTKAPKQHDEPDDQAHTSPDCHASTGFLVFR